MDKKKLRHQGTVVLETDRLRLRPFKRGDARAIFENWANDPEVTTYLSWLPYDSPRDVQKTLDEWVSAYAKKDTYNWAITKKGSDEVIGSISVVHKNDSIRMVQIGYCIGRAYQNNGYMTEALKRLIAFLFDEVGCNRVESHHDPRNLASGKVMLKAGLRFEGTMRQAHWNNQGIADTSMYAILSSDPRPTP